MCIVPYSGHLILATFKNLIICGNYLSHLHILFLKEKKFATSLFFSLQQFFQIKDHKKR